MNFEAELKTVMADVVLPCACVHLESLVVADVSWELRMEQASELEERRESQGLSDPPRLSLERELQEVYDAGEEAGTAHNLAALDVADCDCAPCRMVAALSSGLSMEVLEALSATTAVDLS